MPRCLGRLPAALVTSARDRGSVCHGMAMTTDSPAPDGGTRTGSRRRRDAAAAPASSRRRCPSAAPSARPPTVRRRRRALPCSSLSPSRRAEMSMWPGPDFFATPCLIAFSTSGCRIRFGTSVSSVSGCTSKRTTRRSAKRVCSICKILCEEVELRLERDLLLPDVLERQAQEVAQPHQRPIGRLDVAMHQRRDRVQRVEEEVRVQLLLQRLELRLDEPGLELRRAQRAILATRGNRGRRG